MDNHNFDKRLKSVLDGLEVPYEQGTWAALEQRLNAPFAEEHPAAVDAVDKALYHTLEGLEAPYQSSHWEQLSQQMNRQRYLRRRIRFTKLAEAAIFLLLLVNLNGFLHLDDDIQRDTPAPASKHLQANSDHGIEQSVPGTTSGAGFALQFAGHDDRASGRQHENMMSSVALFDPELMNTNIPSGPGEEALVLLNPTETPTPEHWASLPNIVKLPILLGAPLESMTPPSPYAAPVVQVNAPRQHRFYAATYAVYDRNYVRSADHAHNANGYGAGIGIGYRIGKWGIETGLSYSRKQYEPRREEEIYSGNTQVGYYGSFTKSVDADLISVPVKVTRRVAQFGQASAHAVAGATAHFALDKSYQYGSTYYPGQAPPDPHQSVGQQPQLRKVGRGLLENGSLQGNTYATADAGLRVEHPLGRRFVAFVEPAYHHAFGKRGIGPSPARINTFSVQAGVLATL